MYNNSLLYKNTTKKLSKISCKKICGQKNNQFMYVSLCYACHSVNRTQLRDIIAELVQLLVMPPLGVAHSSSFSLLPHEVRVDPGYASAERKKPDPARIRNRITRCKDKYAIYFTTVTTNYFNLFS